MNYHSEKPVSRQRMAVGRRNFPSRVLRRLRPAYRRLLTDSCGFTLVELIVVVIIIGLLAGLVLPQFIRQEEKAKLKAAQAQIELLGTALDTFRLDVGRYPTSDEGLQGLRQKPGAAGAREGPH